MVTYEVFLKKDGRDEFRHAGALDAANDELALVLARESYAAAPRATDFGSSDAST